MNKMDYFQKSEMSQLMPSTATTTSINYTPDLYSAYADSFDLSLLSTDESETSSSLSASSATSTSPETNKYQLLSSSLSSSSDVLGYITTTIFNNNNNNSNEQSMTFSNSNNNNNKHNNNNNINTLSSNHNIIPIIKTEKLWICDSTVQSQNNNNNNNNNNNLLLIENNNFNIDSPLNYTKQIGGDDCSTATTAASLLFQQLQKQYQFYPSPLPSPPQYEFCNLNSVSSSNNYSLYSPASSTLSPSPCPSLDQQINSFSSTNCLNNSTQNFPQVKQEYLILPPSPPESNGSPSPSLNEIKSEPGDNEIEANLIDINILLEKTLQNFEENQKKLQQEEEKIQQQQQDHHQHHHQQQLNNNQQLNSTVSTTTTITSQPQDHQLLREYLQDTTFQKKHNLKPLALESLIGGLGVRGDIEPVISLALEHAKRDAQATCAQLQISPDPQQWTTTQVHAWIQSTIEQFKLQQINELELKFPEDGVNLLCLSEEEFIRRLPESGATIHAQLEIWKLACCDNFPIDMFPAIYPSTSTINNNNNNNSWSTNDCDMDLSDDEDNDMETQSSITTLNSTNENGQQITSTTTTTKSNITETSITHTSQPTTTSATTISTSNPSTQAATTTTATTTSTSAPTNNTQATKSPRTGGSHIHLWQFLKELLASPQVHGTAIRWLDRNKGVFKIEDSVRVAKLWGRRKNRPAMNYDKLSRSIRQYYKKGIMKKTERSQRLVYQFCHPYCL